MEKLTKTDNGQWTIEKAEILEKPPVSEAQRKAMWAAASGKSNLGIPASVGKEFANKDTGGKLPEKVKKEEEETDKSEGETSNPRSSAPPYPPEGIKVPENAGVCKEEEMDKSGPLSSKGNGNMGGSTLMRAEELKLSAHGQWSLEKAEGKPNMKAGFFHVDHLHAMDKAGTHDEAKQIAHAAIDAQKGATPENTKKAKLMVDQSKSKKHLMIGASNFMLSHPSENLGMGTKGLSKPQ